LEIFKYGYLMKIKIQIMKSKLVLHWTGLIKQKLFDLDWACCSTPATQRAGFTWKILSRTT
jgi:hypothetical protein